MRCPVCSTSTTEVLETRQLGNGSIRRRHRCRLRGHRWTSYEGDPPRPTSPTPDQVREILLATGSDQAIARQVGRCAALVRLIRCGQAYGELWPELPRRSRVNEDVYQYEGPPFKPCGSQRVARKAQPEPALVVVGTRAEVRRTGPKRQCFNCAHWRDHCLMSIPEGELEGPSFAEECEIFLPSLAK